MDGEATRKLDYEDAQSGDVSEIAGISGNERCPRKESCRSNCRIGKFDSYATADRSGNASNESIK